jgi:hypothetical protein
MENKSLGPINIKRKNIPIDRKNVDDWQGPYSEIFIKLHIAGVIFKVEMQYLSAKTI